MRDPAANNGRELARSPREPPSVNCRLEGDPTPMQVAKRYRDATPESDRLPAKKARLLSTNTQQLGTENETQTKKTTLQQPEPRRSKRSYASFLDDFADEALVHRRPELLCTFVSEWLESVESDREKHCRSDSHLHPSDEQPVARLRTRSAPVMVKARDIGGFTVPPTPSSTGPPSFRADLDDDRSRSSSSSTANVRNPRYRQNNLRFNCIHVRHATSPLPVTLSGHVDSLRAQRSSPGLSSDDLNQAMYRIDVLAEGCDEEQVVKLLDDTVFPDPEGDDTFGPATGLMSNSSTLMAQHLVPADGASPYRVTQPKPDRLYGYSERTVGGAFTQSQLLAQTMLHDRNPDYTTATSRGLRFPFLAIQFKAVGGTRGDLWVAANQCAAASSACLNAVHQLNISLQACQSTRRVDNLSYCIAVDNKLAELYISWREDSSNYYLQQVDTFVLSRPVEFQSFRTQVRNILDWGKDARLTQIGDALDVILEENRKNAAQAAKSRTSPPDDPAASAKRQKPSSRRNSKGSQSSQTQICATNPTLPEAEAG
ncbi:hypothetical protein CDD83_3021 [Cordyceps sp. RAO-2017]|nr:hypothetical protein CDD83_3021 [Cordyceps sp. RAO-2017]